MELQTYINLAVRLMNMHFVLGGVSVSVMEILVYFGAAAILVTLMKGILS